MATPEGKVKDKVRTLLKQHGAYYYQPVTNGMGAPSLDFIICHRGLFAMVETKAPGKKPTPLQDVTIETVRRHGGLVFVIAGEVGMDSLAEWLQRK